MAWQLLSCFIIHLLFLTCFAQRDYGSGYKQLVYNQLDLNFYRRSCPQLPMILRFNVMSALRNDNRMSASLLRLHFHDCFVDGCEGSVLLDDTKDMLGEKNAFPNRNSVRGFDVIDNIKEDVERACPMVVSCVDILALAAREAVALSGGPFWPVPLGRRDGFTARQQAANEQLPSPFEPLVNITAKFTSKGLDIKDVVVLSGAHTIGFAQCFTFKRRLFDYKSSGKPDPTMDSAMLSSLQSTCPNTDKADNVLSPLDNVSSSRFDNAYYTNLLNNKGLLESDQALMGDRLTASMVGDYSNSPNLYNKDFSMSMLKLGQVGILTGSKIGTGWDTHRKQRANQAEMRGCEHRVHTKIMCYS